MLVDEKIYLRKLESDDLDRTWVWINQPEIYLIMGVNAPISKTSQKRWFENLEQAQDKMVFAICLQEKDKHIGNVSIDNIDLRHRNARLSIFIADKSLRNKEIGTRSLKLLVEYAFYFLNLHRVYVKMSPSRNDVLKFYKNLGFEVEGQLREHEYIEGSYKDKLVLGLLQSDYERLKEKTNKDLK